MNTRRKVLWIFGCYVMVLLFSLFVLNVLPKENFSDNNLVSQKSLEQLQELNYDFYPALDGWLEQTDGVNMVGRKEYKFDGNTLKLVTSSDSLNLMILVEKTEAINGIVEVINYQTITIIERIDVTDDIKPPTVSMVGNSMIIKPEQLKVVYAKFKKDFVVAQFMSEGIDQEDSFRETVIGSQLLYLRVPKDVQIEDTGLGIQYISPKINK